MESSEKYHEYVKKVCRKISKSAEKKYINVITVNNETKTKEVSVLAHTKSYYDKGRKEIDIKWPLVSEFTIELGEEKLREMIDTCWNYPAYWLYQLSYLESGENRFENLHFYSVKWSIPTRRQPVPRFTVLQTFTYKLSKKRINIPVQVIYNIESQKQTFNPESIIFNSVWLHRVIDMKNEINKKL
ncbi:hypothetical protein SNEBB_011275 [Seison nebaliae]|nr:hypothetical protein SNEBB_011275 [Seison nebaliae]